MKDFTPFDPPKLTKEKLDLEGVVLSVEVHIGDWWRAITIGQDYKDFKKKLHYAKIHDQIEKDIEYALKKGQ